MRNKLWLEEKFYTLLRDNNVALTLIDHSWMPPMNEITADVTYIRWEGDRRKIKGTTGKPERDRTDDIRKWALKIENLLADNIEVYGYFSNNYSGYGPTDTKELIGLLKR